MSSSSSTSPTIIQSLIIDIYYRRLLLHTPLCKQPTQLRSSWTSPAGSEPDSTTPEGYSFDANVVLILAVLLCALICALGLKSIVRCALRCSNRMAVEPESNPVVRFTETGIRRKALRTLPTLVYSAGLKLHRANPECAICLSDFVPGERVRVLPKCDHGFHARCIDRWLVARSSCPTCRRCLFGSSPKTSGCAETNHPGPVPVRPVLVPLEPEGLLTNYES